MKSSYAVDIHFADLPLGISDSQALAIATDSVRQSIPHEKIFIDMLYHSPSIVFNTQGQEMPGKKYLVITHLEQKEMA